MKYKHVNKLYDESEKKNFRVILYYLQGILPLSLLYSVLQEIDRIESIVVVKPLSPSKYIKTKRIPRLGIRTKRLKWVLN